MDKSSLKPALPYVLAFATGGVIIWGIVRYLKPPSNKGKNPVDKYRYASRSFEELELAEWELVGEVDKLWIYPVKSCCGISITEAVAERHGLKHGHLKDRFLMIVDKNGMMVTGRKENNTVLIMPSVNNATTCVTLTYPHLQPLQIDISYLELDGRAVKCRLWDENVSGIDCGEEAADWLKLAFNKPYRLVYHGRTDSSRSMHYKKAFPMIRSSDSGLYADLGGYMLMSTSSLEDLRDRVSMRVPSENFRPNILIKESRAYDEDNWTYIKIENTIFRNIKPCERCIFTTIDFKTAKRNPKTEPLKTLRKYRCKEGNENPYFGINLGIDRVGKISVNDKVYVLRN